MPAQLVLQPTGAEAFPVGAYLYARTTDPDLASLSHWIVETVTPGARFGGRKFDCQWGQEVPLLFRVGRIDDAGFLVPSRKIVLYQTAPEGELAVAMIELRQGQNILWTGAPGVDEYPPDHQFRAMFDTRTLPHGTEDTHYGLRLKCWVEDTQNNVRNYVIANFGLRVRH